MTNRKNNDKEWGRKSKKKSDSKKTKSKLDEVFDLIYDSWDIIFFSLSRYVTPSMNILIFTGITIHNEIVRICVIIDYGIDQNDIFKYYGFLIPEDAIVILVITHNHIDHSVEGATEPDKFDLILTSYETKLLISYALADTKKITDLECKKKNVKPIFTSESCKKFLDKIQGLEYGEKFSITSDISITLIKNGHCLGASMVFIEFKNRVHIFNGEILNKNSISFFFTGDYKKDNPFFDVPEIPEWIREKNKFVVTESTYGSDSVLDIVHDYIPNILEGLRKKCSVVLPAFGFERYQHILLLLKRAQDDNLLSKSIPIFAMGTLGLAYTFVYKMASKNFKEESKDFIPKNVKVCSPLEMDTIFNTKGPKIILSTSGMGSYGPAHSLISHYISDPSAYIIFPGYVAEGTLGRQLMDVEQGERVVTTYFATCKRAKVLYTNELSGHARQEDLLELYKDLGNIQGIFITHGEPESRKVFKDYLEKQMDLGNLQKVPVEILGPDFKYRIYTNDQIKKIDVTQLMKAKKCPL